jgi:hypothetical protein
MDIDNTKIYQIVFILTVIFIFLLIIIILISQRQKQKEGTILKKENISTKESQFFDYRVGKNNLGKNNNENNNNDENKKIIPPISKKISSSQRVIPDFAGEDGYGEEDLTFLYRNELKNKLPLETDSFSISYDKSEDKLIVVFKNNSEEDKKKFFEWLAINGLKDKEGDFLFKQNASTPQNLPRFTPTSSFSNDSFELLVDMLKILFSTTNCVGCIPSAPPVTIPSSPSPTGNISNYSSTPLGYNSNAKGCYTPKRFIEVYADGLVPSGPPNCYQNVKQRVESYLRIIPFLGFNIRVHQKVVPYFQAVDQELSSYKISGSTYRFSRGEYTFKNCGTYVFRCNVNASRCDRYDLCNSNCVLSPHSFGFAIDLNCDTNANKSVVYDMPPEVVAAFRRHGFRWGGEWNDAMHFEYLGEICPIK